MLWMDQVHVIRHKVLREGTSIRQVARELGLSRNTVSKYLEQSVPVHRTYRRRRKRPVWGRAHSRMSESRVMSCWRENIGSRSCLITRNYNLWHRLDEHQNPAKSGFSTGHSRRGFWPGRIMRARPYARVLTHDQQALPLQLAARLSINSPVCGSRTDSSVRATSSGNRVIRGMAGLAAGLAR
jgi:DNA-binding transcriptional MocR family regulator